MSAIGPNDAEPCPPPAPIVPCRRPGWTPGAARLVRGLRRAVDVLRGEINDLNVFPIPDSDTGSNMLHTMSAAGVAARETDPGRDRGGRAAGRADAAVAQARGNSGSSCRRSWSVWPTPQASRPSTTCCRSTVCGRGLGLAGLSATRAVSEPREGTVLTVLRETARTAATEAAVSAPGDLARAVADACADALDRTTEQLPELAAAGVVDAGGRGPAGAARRDGRGADRVSAPRRRYEGALSGGGAPEPTPSSRTAATRSARRWTTR